MVELVRNTGLMSCRSRCVDGMLSSNAQLVGVFGGMGLTDRQRWNVIVYTRFYDFGGRAGNALMAPCDGNGRWDSWRRDS